MTLVAMEAKQTGLYKVGQINDEQIHIEIQNKIKEL